MAIEVASSFERKSGVPLDDKEVVADIAARDAIPALVRYIGMMITVLDNGEGLQKKYWLKDGTDNTDWEEFSSGGGGGGFSNIVTKTSSATILASEDCVIANPSASMTLTLPVGTLKEIHNFIRADAVESRTVTIQTSGDDLILTSLGLVSEITLPYQGNTAKLVYIDTDTWGLF